MDQIKIYRLTFDEIKNILFEHLDIVENPDDNIYIGFRKNGSAMISIINKDYEKELEEKLKNDLKSIED